MTPWRRSSKGERCGFCGVIFTGPHKGQPGEPIWLYGATGLKRCAKCAKARYGADVPVPFPEPVPPSLPQRSRQPDFVTSTRLVSDYRSRQIGSE